MQVTLAGHSGAVTALRYNRTGALLASGAQDTDVIVWDVVAEAGLFRLRAHTGQVTDLVRPGMAALSRVPCMSASCSQGSAGSSCAYTMPNPQTVSPTSAVLCGWSACRQSSTRQPPDIWIKVASLSCFACMGSHAGVHASNACRVLHAYAPPSLDGINRCLTMLHCPCCTVFDAGRHAW